MSVCGRRPRIALNALLYSRSLTYRGAGVSHYIDGLLHALPKSDPGSDYTAFVSEPDLEMDGWRFIYPRSASSKPSRRILWEQFAQPGALKRAQADLVHAPVYVGPLHAPCPVVVTIHDLSHFIYPELFQPAKRVYLRAMTRYTAEHAAAVICDSESTRRDVLRILHIPETRTHTVLIAADAEMRPLPKETVARFKQEYQLPPRYILCVGTLEPRKNITALLKAYAILYQQNHSIPHLVIGGGKGWYYRSIEQQVEQLSLNKQVLFTGFIPQSELPLWYNGAELFIYPSTYEGFGLPPLEAMACGVPVVTSNRSSLPEVVGNGGVL
ncbi:MAG: glycosyltransferase family 4 protein, partial [Chloroflexi bacterium]|nr:glycosyltransferase family 4 protein [Chloroflexota bacterium]